MRIKRFNESADYSSYHPISDEDINDIALEMTDAGFSIEIERYFLNSDCTRTKQPLSDKCIPIYDLCFEKQKEGDYSQSYRWNGSYYYENIDVLKMFTSTLNKMKLLPIEDSGYYISNDRYNIRLFLKKLDLSPDQVGFDIDRFGDKFYEMLERISRESKREPVDFQTSTLFIIEHWKQYGESVEVVLYTDGKYHYWDNKIDEWTNAESFDNKSQYDIYIKKIDDYLDKYKKFISYEHDFEEINPEVKRFKGKFLKKNFSKTYNRYELTYKIKLK